MLNVKRKMKEYHALNGMLISIVVPFEGRTGYIEKILYLLPYLVLLLSTLLLLIMPVKLMFSSSFIYLHYLIKTKDPATLRILITLDILTQFIIMPASFLRRLIMSD